MQDLALVKHWTSVWFNNSSRRNMLTNWSKYIKQLLILLKSGGKRHQEKVSWFEKLEMWRFWRHLMSSTFYQEAVQRCRGDCPRRYSNLSFSQTRPPHLTSNLYVHRAGGISRRSFQYKCFFVFLCVYTKLRSLWKPQLPWSPENSLKGDLWIIMLFFSYCRPTSSLDSTALRSLIHLPCF